MDTVSSRQRCPFWQVPVRRAVGAAIRKKNPAWAKRLATFLRQQAAALERAYSVTPTPTRLDGMRKRLEAIRAVLVAHPDWSVRQIAEVVHLAPGTVQRYVTRLRKKHGLPVPQGGRPRREAV